MKKFITIILMLGFIACEEEHNTPTKPIDDDFDPEVAIKLKMGDFSGVSGHSVSGTASVFDSNGTQILVLDPFNSQNGPDLKVYLSKDAGAGTYVDLGSLKSTTGKQSYEIPAGFDIHTYPYVLIWCQKFSVGFGKAETD